MTDEKKEMPWQKVYENSYERPQGHVDSHFSEGHTDEAIGEFYTPMSCCCKQPEHMIRSTIKNGRFVPEAQASALWEGVSFLIELSQRIKDGRASTQETGLCVIEIADALLKKGIGE